MSELSKLMETRSPAAKPANLANSPPEISRISNISRGVEPKSYLAHDNNLQIPASPSVQSVDTLRRKLLRERRGELREAAGDAWTEISQDSAQLIAFAGLEATRQIRESGAIPDSYVAMTLCNGCQREVPIFVGCPPIISGCPWCFNRLKGLPIPRTLHFEEYDDE